MALQLLHGHDGSEYQERRDHPAVGERHEHGDEPGDRGADHRKEAPEKHQKGQGDHQRYTQDEQRQPDPESVDQRDGGGAPHVARQRGPGAAVGR